MNKSQAAPPTPQPHARASLAPTQAALNGVPVHSSDLFKGQKTVLIEHNGTSYRLQTTKLGKLILTK